MFKINTSNTFSGKSHSPTALSESLREFETLYKDYFNPATKDTLAPSYITKTQNSYIIELALVGFKKDQVSVTQQGNTLTVSAFKQSESHEDSYTRRKTFPTSVTNSFTVPPNHKVKDVVLTSGLLTVTIVEDELDPEIKTFTVK